MLSRVANCLYWMSRYIERAENVARFIDVNLQIMLDTPAGESEQWQPLVNTTGDHEDYAKRYGTATREKVIEFLAFDPANPNSILSCVRSARENARTVMLQSAGPERSDMDRLQDFFAEVKEASQLFAGITDATMSHGEAWHFCRLGRELERADKTSRILDVKYFLLLRSAEDVGTPFDDLQWAAVLRSASAFEMYRKRHGRISPKGVVEFLVLSRDFPRAILFCLMSARDSLHAISGTPLGTFNHPAEKLLGQLCSDLSFTSVEEIIKGGLHEYLDELQTKVNAVGAGIYETFFAFKTPKHTRRPARQPTQ